MAEENNEAMIYHAEDESIIRNLVRSIVGMIPGSHLEQHEEGSGLLKKLANGEVQAPAVVVIDNQMPGATGLELMAYARDPLYGGKVPFIFISGDGADVLRSALDSGAYATFGKPFNLMELKSTIEEAAEYSRNSLND
ncbi:MAG: response regulator [Nanoarchaeota archaeon]|nr:response regulator [Nanoarchaeota archaeon]